jgi:hypothetical protein
MDGNQIMEITEKLSKRLLFAGTFHPFQELRKVPDLEIGAYLTLFEIDFSILKV